MPDEPLEPDDMPEYDDEPVEEVVQTETAPPAVLTTGTFRPAPPLPEPQPPDPLANYLTAPVLAMLRGNPTSHSILAVVSNEIGFGIPNDLPDLEAITKYIIDQFEKLQAEREKANAAFMASLTGDLSRPAQTPAIVIPVNHRDTEYGTAAYSVRRSGVQQLGIPRAALINMINSADDWDNLRDHLRDYVSENNDINAADAQDGLNYGGYDYQPEEATNHEDHRYDIQNEDEMMRHVIQFIRENMPDELHNFE